MRINNSSNSNMNYATMSNKRLRTAYGACPMPSVASSSSSSERGMNHQYLSTTTTTNSNSSDTAFYLPNHCEPQPLETMGNNMSLDSMEGLVNFRRIAAEYDYLINNNSSRKRQPVDQSVAALQHHHHQQQQQHPLYQSQKNNYQQQQSLNPDFNPHFNSGVDGEDSEDADNNEDDNNDDEMECDVRHLGNDDDDDISSCGSDSSSNQESLVKLRLSNGGWESKQFLSEVLEAPLHEIGMLSLISRLDWSLPLPTITDVLNKAQQLTTLSMYSLLLQGNKHDFEEFSEALRAHPSLKEIHFVDCSLVDQTISVDSLLLALAVIPTLETVEIHAMDLDRESSIGLMSPSSLAELCKSKSVISLKLEDLDLTDDHVKEVAASISDNHTMKNLTLWDCNVSDEAGKMLATALEVNTSLEKLDLSLNNLRSAAFHAFAQALCINRTLWSFSLHGNTHLVKESRGTGSGYDAIVEVLKDQNHIIEEMILESAEDPRVSFYLMINRNRHLLQENDVTREQIVDCLSDNTDHHSFLYYLLRTNPDLCDVER